jgi:hypothetical protein
MAKPFKGIINVDVTSPSLGSPRTYNHYPTGWACAFNTPFKPARALTSDARAPSP